MSALISLQLRQGHPDLLDLPWDLPLGRWGERCARLVEVERGLSRHEVVFASYGRTVYALKELPVRVGQREYDVLRGLEERAWDGNAGGDVKSHESPRSNLRPLLTKRTGDQRPLDYFVKQATMYADPHRILTMSPSLFGGAS